MRIKVIRWKNNWSHLSIEYHLKDFILKEEILVLYDFGFGFILKEEILVLYDFGFLLFLHIHESECSHHKKIPLFDNENCI